VRRAALAAPLLLARLPGVARASAAIDVRERGARGDGRSLDTRAIQAAIDEGARSGREVRCPAGDYLSGTLRLRDGTTLRLDAGATLIASPRDEDFDRPEALGYETFADEETSIFDFALLQGRGVKDIRIVGGGRIDGNRKAREGPKPIALKRCAAVVIRDITIVNAGNYNISLLGCDGVDVEGVTILNGYADGIDPDCCRNVRIAGCRIESRDDAVCLKTSLALGVRRATENVRIVGCRLATFHNAIKLGTESSGDFRNIAVSDCAIAGWRHVWKGDLSSGLSVELVDGGSLDRLSAWNIQMAGVRAPIFVRLARRGRGQATPRPGTLQDVAIRDVVATDALVASTITGVPGHPIERIALRRIKVHHRGGREVDRVSLLVPEMESRYPDATMFDDLPAYGLYCRHVAGLAMDDMELTIDRGDARSAMVLDDVADVRLRGLEAVAPAADGPLVWLHAVRDAQLRGLAPRGGGRQTIARVSGAATDRMLLVPSAAVHRVVVDGDVRATALEVAGPS